VVKIYLRGGRFLWEFPTFFASLVGNSQSILLVYWWEFPSMISDRVGNSQVL
jgi:hypothetical protein